MSTNNKQNTGTPYGVPVHRKESVSIKHLTSGVKINIPRHITNDQLLYALSNGSEDMSSISLDIADTVRAYGIEVAILFNDAGDRTMSITGLDDFNPEMTKNYLANLVNKLALLGDYIVTWSTIDPDNPNGVHSGGAFLVKYRCPPIIVNPANMARAILGMLHGE